MRICFTGHRDKVFDDTWLRGLARLYPEAVWVHGGAMGFDTLVNRIGVENGMELEVHLPNYAKYAPRQAPLVRNKEMIDSGIELLVAGYDGRASGGTLYTINCAKQKGIKVIYIAPESE